MIQLAEDVEYLESRKVLIPSTLKKFFIEVSSTNKIHIAVVDEELAKMFDASESGEDVAIDWVENTRIYDTEYENARLGKRYLLLWNCNEDQDAVIAYKFTPLAVG